MPIRDLIVKNRSYRRFYQDEKVTPDQLRKLVDLARLSPSGANLQPLKFIFSNSAEKNDMIFPCMAWAGYLKDWAGPEEGERPSAYIIILGDASIKTEPKNDQGIAAQSILLGAVEMGLGGCMIGSIKREKLRDSLGISAQYEILLAIALGKPKETVVIDDMGSDNDVRYWRDENQVHHVPKRSLNDLILE